MKMTVDETKYKSGFGVVTEPAGGNLKQKTLLYQITIKPVEMKKHQTIINVRCIHPDGSVDELGMAPLFLNGMITINVPITLTEMSWFQAVENNEKDMAI